MHMYVHATRQYYLKLKIYTVASLWHHWCWMLDIYNINFQFSTLHNLLPRLARSTQNQCIIDKQTMVRNTSKHKTKQTSDINVSLNYIAQIMIRLRLIIVMVCYNCGICSLISIYRAYYNFLKIFIIRYQI